MTDLFLSYKAEDRRRVAQLVQALEADGYSVWWDADIAGGDDWRATISRYLDAARCVIVVWSKRSVRPAGHFVRDEASRAVRRGVYLPVKIDRVEPPLGFGETQALNLQGWRGDRADPRYQAILSAIRSRLRDGPASARNSEVGVTLNRRATLVAGGGVIGLAALGGWAALRPTSGRANSVAVLPFANLSGNPEEAYFSDGIAEELRTRLSRIAGLRVVARISSEAMRNADARTAARKLNVANILTGSVRRSKDTLRISAQLVDGVQGVDRWAEVYDRPNRDALQIQTDIANKVADALSIRLADVERPAGGTDNPDAQDLVLKARDTFTRDDSDEGARSALAMVDKALRLDPAYADAAAEKASLLLRLTQYARSAAEAEQGYVQAERVARHAVALDPRSARAHSALASALFHQFKIREALYQFSVMSSLLGDLSGDGAYLGSYAYILIDVGRSDRALEVADRMVAADPLSPLAHHSQAQALYDLGRLEQAMAAEDEAIALGPALTWPRGWRARILMRMGKLDEAKAEFASLQPRTGPWSAWEAILAERQGNRAESDRLLTELRRRAGDTMHYQYAQILANQGRKDEAFAELELAWNARDAGLTSIRRDEMFKPLRGDPRFENIIRRVDFP